MERRLGSKGACGAGWRRDGSASNPDESRILCCGEEGGSGISPKPDTTDGVTDEESVCMAVWEMVFVFGGRGCAVSGFGGIVVLFCGSSSSARSGLTACASRRINLAGGS
ncbi:MAG: hypothetical protein LBU34_11280 [Planctomycetaceae bacterium]|nr:hypothetical protein [Planctomycetaceae bacterium]